MDLHDQAANIGEIHRSIFDGLDLGHAAGHAVSLGTLLGVVAGVLPALAALGAVIWYGIAIYETKTVQSLLHRRKQRRMK